MEKQTDPAAGPPPPAGGAEQPSSNAAQPSTGASQPSSTRRGELPERLRRLLSGEVPPPPIVTLLGMRLESAGNGAAVFSLEVRPERFANVMGTVHGGILCDLADAAMGLAYASTLADDESFTTLELKINYLRPVWESRLRAAARVVHGGRSVGLVECDIVDERDRLIARVSSTCLTLRGEQARGR